jgi:hypothetical protein
VLFQLRILENMIYSVSLAQAVARVIVN